MHTQSNLFPDNSGAVLSDCGKHRFKLWRTWNPGAPRVLFIMLNPSTADHTKDDPTIRRCISLANQWGFGGLMVGNLFPCRSSNPDDIHQLWDPAFDGQNERALRRMASQCGTVVFAWGCHPSVGIRNAAIISMFPAAMVIQKTMYGHPRHPLYIKNGVVPAPYQTDIHQKP